MLVSVCVDRWPVGGHVFVYVCHLCLLLCAICVRFCVPFVFVSVCHLRSLLCPSLCSCPCPSLCSCLTFCVDVNRQQRRACSAVGASLCVLPLIASWVCVLRVFLFVLPSYWFIHCDIIVLELMSYRGIKNASMQQFCCFIWAMICLSCSAFMFWLIEVSSFSFVLLYHFFLL